MIGDPLQELAASWAPFASGLAWAAWCEQDRLSEIAEQLELVHAEQLEAAVFEAQHEVDPPAEVIPDPRRETEEASGMRVVTEAEVLSMQRRAFYATCTISVPCLCGRSVTLVRRKGRRLSTHVVPFDGTCHCGRELMLAIERDSATEPIRDRAA